MFRKLVTVALAATTLAAAVPAVASASTHPKHHGSIPTSALNKKAQEAIHRALHYTHGPTGPQGPAGINGKNGTNGTNGTNGKDGINGLNGLNGVSGYEVDTYDYIKGVDGYPGVGGGAIATVACSSQSKVAVSGGWFMRNGTATDGSMFNSGALANGAGVTASFPGRMDWNTNTPKPNRYDGWIVQFNQNAPQDVTLYAVCINAA